VSTSSFSRRTLLRSIAAGGAALAAPSVLAACSSSGTRHDVSNAGKSLTPWPAYVPFAGPAPDLPGTADGIQPGYLSYPKNLVSAVQDKPGTGQTIKVMTISYGTPPKSASQNRFWAAVNEALGVNIEFTVVPDSDYMTKMATMMAGNDLPDVINLGGGHTLPREAEFVAAQCADLSSYVAGDAIKAYPNLANLPTYAWQDMGRIAGRIHGIPVQRSAPGNCLWINNDVFTAAGMKDGWTADDFLAVAKAATHGRKYGLGSSQPARMCTRWRSARRRSGSWTPGRSSARTPPTSTGRAWSSWSSCGRPVSTSRTCSAPRRSTARRTSTTAPSPRCPTASAR
jgi:putative aldouronate transport system substrate-binding protein